MNARQVATNIPRGPGDSRQALLYARLLLSYLAERIYTAELANGMPVRDVTDFSAFCREVIEEVRKIGVLPENTVEVGPRMKLTRQAQRRWDECNRCGHVHEGIGECGVRMGPNLFCRCEMELSA